MKIRIKTIGHKDDALIQALAVPDVIEADVTVSEIAYLLTNDIKFDGVQAYVEVLLSVLDDDVPENFINSTVVEGELSETTRQKTWREYTTYITNETNAILKVGYHNIDGNRVRPVTSVELDHWIAEFGAGNIMTPAEAKALVESNYNG